MLLFNPLRYRSFRRSMALFGVIGGGALAAYTIGKPTLRRDLAKVHSAEEAVDVISAHLQHDSHKLVKTVRKHGGLRGAWLSAKSRLRRTDDVAMDAADRLEAAADETAKRRTRTKATASR